MLKEKEGEMDSDGALGSFDEGKYFPGLERQPHVPLPSNGDGYHPQFEVVWNGLDDKDNPRNWPSRSVLNVISAGFGLSFNSSLGSSAPSMTIPQYMQQFKVSEEIAVLTLSLYVAGYCAGPLAWGPLSETFGRKRIFVISFGAYLLTCVGCALSNSIASLLFFRFLAGATAAAGQSNSGAVIGDVVCVEKRGLGLSLYSLAPLAGAALGPLVGGVIQWYGLNWRFVYWSCLIMAAATWLWVVLFFPETHHPTILRRKAEKLRKETGDRRYWSSLSREKTDTKTLLYRSLIKPFVMLLEEPLLLLSTLYISLLYGILYMTFEAFPLITTNVHHLGPLEGGASFCAVVFGGAVALLFYVAYYAPRFERDCRELQGGLARPELRLSPAKPGAILFPIAIMLLGWTGSYPTLNLWFPIVGLALMGASIWSLFMAFYSYLIDIYTERCATALAINIVVRSFFGATFPLLSSGFFQALGIKWGATLIGGLAFLGMPMPYLFMAYGERIRAKSMGETSLTTSNSEKKLCVSIGEIQKTLRREHEVKL